jgi:hypothetical protein
MAAPTAQEDKSVKRCSRKILLPNSRRGSIRAVRQLTGGGSVFSSLHPSLPPMCTAFAKPSCSKAAESQ